MAAKKGKALSQKQPLKSVKKVWPKAKATSKAAAKAKAKDAETASASKKSLKDWAKRLSYLSHLLLLLLLFECCLKFELFSISRALQTLHYP